MSLNKHKNVIFFIRSTEIHLVNLIRWLILDVTMLLNDNAKIGLDDHMVRVFKALAGVEMTISIIFCFMGYLRYTEINDRYQRLYDRGKWPSEQIRLNSS